MTRVDAKELDVAKKTLQALEVSEARDRVAHMNLDSKLLLDSLLNNPEFDMGNSGGQATDQWPVAAGYLWALGEAKGMETFLGLASIGEPNDTDYTGIPKGLNRVQFLTNIYGSSFDPSVRFSQKMFAFNF